MAEKKLKALLAGRVVGEIREEKNRLQLEYVDDWRAYGGAMPLSLSMPLAVAQHAHKPVNAYLWGLLPDSEPVLSEWGRRFHVSPRNPFSLLTHVGEDCAGAIQLVSQERVEQLDDPKISKIVWLDEMDISNRLGTLRQTGTDWRRTTDAGQFSLAGAQPKTALLFENGKWGVPSGKIPTTHILKPPTGEFDGFAENEHFCLSLAARLGLPVAHSTVQRFGSETAIVVERFDRAHTSALAAAAAAEAAAGAAEVEMNDAINAVEASRRAAALAELAKKQPILRLHQEDMCQAMALLPSQKYQSEGGPSPKDIVQLLRENSSSPVEDVRTFIDALIFNWLVAATDAHAKNYSLLHGARGQVRLAPLYDIASALPYDEIDKHRAKLAMKIGNRYRILEIGAEQWRQLASDLSVSGEEVAQRIVELADGISQAVPELLPQTVDRGLNHPILQALSGALMERAGYCARAVRVQ